MRLHEKKKSLALRAVARSSGKPASQANLPPPVFQIQFTALLGGLLSRDG
jgi:hypothetical protein